MKMYKGSVIALSVMILMLIFRLAVGGIKVDRKYNVEGERTAITDISLEEVDKIDFENSDDSFTIVRENNSFYIKDRKSETDKNEAEKLVNDILRIDGRLLEKDCKDTAQYGFENPKASVRFYVGGKSTAVKIGNLTPAETEYYVMADDGSVYSIYSSGGSRLLSRKWQLMDLTLFTGGYSNITAVSVNGQNSFSAEKQSDGKWKIESEKDGNYEAEDEKFRAVVGRYLDNMYAKRLVSNNEEKRSEYGFDNPEGVVTIIDADKNKTEFKICRNTDKKEAAVIKNDGNDIFITIIEYFDMLDIKKEDLT